MDPPSAALTTTVGYPCMGGLRELKTALEAYWRKDLSSADLTAALNEVEEAGTAAAANAGVRLVGVGDATLWGPFADTTTRLGLEAPRHRALPAGLDRYFAAARGAPGAAALDASKWLNTNFHVLVPEIGGEGGATLPPPADAPGWDDLVARVRTAQAAIGGSRVVPILLGPVTYAAGCALSGGVTVASLVEAITPCYVAALRAFGGAQVPEVQLHEPALVTSDGPALRPVYEAAFAALAEAGLPIHLVTFFDDLGDTFPWAVRLPGVTAVGLDFTRGDNLGLLRTHGWPTGVRLGAGVVDGRSVWAEETASAALLDSVRAEVGAGVTVCVQPSCSLAHLPLDLDAETALPPAVKVRLAFAKQKLDLLVRVAGEVAGDTSPAASSATPEAAAVGASEAITSAIDEALFERAEPFEKRRPKQFSVPGGMGTMSIGSFPQTSAIRRLRAQFKAGKVPADEYEAAIDAATVECVRHQKDFLGLDVLVHGELERTDMVEFFADKMNGVSVTKAGWVRSIGSLCVRPPIIHDDLSRRQVPMTVREWAVAQAAAGDTPVKGMLTGPTTLLNWSFPRKDLSREAQAMQLAKVVRAEVADLEAAGARIIQVDEPALREGLPLKRPAWAADVAWAVRAFRLATTVAAPTTQVVTHFCYSDFSDPDVLAAMDALDADVLTVENTRSGGEAFRALAAAGYARDLAPGVFDIHSEVVPTVAEVADRIQTFLDAGLEPTRLWVVPDCGQKTASPNLCATSLKAMVTAAVAARSAGKATSC